MGKLLNIYTTITSRIDAALVTGQPLAYFTRHYKGIRLDKEINQDVNCPFIITTLGSGQNVENDLRNRSIDLEVITIIKSAITDNDNQYENSTTSKGIIRDIEKVIDVINSDGNLGGNTDNQLDYRIEIEKEGTSYLMATITWTAKTPAFRYGTLSS